MNNHERNLWVSVLFRAVEDAFGVGTQKTFYMGVPQDHDRDAALAWFRADSRHYRWICDAVGFDAEILRRGVLDGQAVFKPSSKTRATAKDIESAVTAVIGRASGIMEAAA